MSQSASEAQFESLIIMASKHEPSLLESLIYMKGD